ncbi:MAG TPA: winged helix DNA-binding domain-containing protein [Pilimelia sp.]|nr:winged helix DNA-binding domain-containing protein [Pilimelia sp.]
MDASDIPHHRLRQLRLTGPPLAAPPDVVRALGAVQAQDYGPATWAVGQRVAGATAEAVDRAVDEGAILRTHVMRPTWHFVPAADIGWLQALTAPRVHAQNAYYYRRFGLDADAFAASHRALTGALRGGNAVTRAQAQAILASAGIAASGLGLAYVLMHAELAGLICSGPRAGKHHTYALLAERVTAPRELDRDGALAELARRYFTSHGPATAADFRWWSSLTAADVTRGIELAGAAVTRHDVDGTAFWSAPHAETPHAETPHAETPPSVHLLQGYDEYIMGYTGDSKYLLDAAGHARFAGADRPAFNHVLIVDGQVAGHWKRTVRRGGVHLDVALHRPLDGAGGRALRAAADRHGRFLGLPATVATAPL